MSFNHPLDASHHLDFFNDDSIKASNMWDASRGWSILRNGYVVQFTVEPFGRGTNNASIADPSFIAFAWDMGLVHGSSLFNE